MAWHWTTSGRTDRQTDGCPLFLLFVYELFLLPVSILNLRYAFPYDENFVVLDPPILSNITFPTLFVDTGGPELLRNVSYLFIQIDFTNLGHVHVVVMYKDRGQRSA